MFNFYSLYWLWQQTAFPQTGIEKFKWFFNDISRIKSQISQTIPNVMPIFINTLAPDKCFNTNHLLSGECHRTSLNEKSTLINVLLVHYLSQCCINLTTDSKFNSYIFPWTTDPIFKDCLWFFSISSSFHEIEWLFPVHADMLYAPYI